MRSSESRAASIPFAPVQYALRTKLWQHAYPHFPACAGGGGGGSGSTPGKSERLDEGRADKPARAGAGGEHMGSLRIGRAPPCQKDPQTDVWLLENTSSSYLDRGTARSVPLMRRPARSNSWYVCADFWGRERGPCETAQGSRGPASGIPCGRRRGSRKAGKQQQQSGGGGGAPPSARG